MKVINTEDWSQIEEPLPEDTYTSTINSKEKINLGIYRSGDEYRTRGLVGITRLKGENKNSIKPNGKEVILKVSPRFGVNIVNMLNSLKDDEEFARYLSTSKSKNNNEDKDDIDGESNDLYHFYNEPPIKVEDDVAKESSIFTVSLFLNLLKELCKKPLYGKMEKIENNLTGKVKGKILFNKHIKYNTTRAREDRIYCQYQKYTVDVIENQILKYALYKSRKFINKFFSDVNGAASTYGNNINFCMKSLEHVSDKAIKSKDCKGLKLNGMYSYYKPVIEAAKMVIDEISITSEGDVKTSNYIQPYAINMQKLFEFYVRSKINNIIKDKDIYLNEFEEKIPVIKKDGTKHNRSPYISGKLMPDIILNYGSKENPKYRVFDVKYKDFTKDWSGSKRNDILQILSYGFIYNCDIIGNIFPYIKDKIGIEESQLNIVGDKKVYYEEILISTSDNINLENKLKKIIFK